MNDTDLEIILAVADGQLTGQAKQDALERIAADPELAEELAAQIAAMDGLRSLEPSLMSSSERAALRSALVAQLNLQPAAPTVAVDKQRRPWWQPVLGLASAAALLLAIVVVPSMLSDNEDGSADLVAIALTETTSVATNAQEDSTESAGTADADRNESTPTVVVPRIDENEVQEFFAAAPPSGDTNVIVSQEDTAAGESSDEPNDSETPSAALLAEPELVAIDAGRLETCMETLADDLPEGIHLARAVTIDDGVATVHLGIDSQEGTTYSFSIDLDTCTITPSTP